MGHGLLGRVFTNHEHKEEIHPLSTGQVAARLVIDTGRPIAHVARELGVNAGLLGRWVKAERERFSEIPAGDIETDEHTEPERLRKEVAELKMDNEFLGKAAFFASKR